MSNQDYRDMRTIHASLLTSFPNPNDKFAVTLHQQASRLHEILSSVIADKGFTVEARI